MCMSVGAQLSDAVRKAKRASFAPTTMPALRAELCGRSGFDEARAGQPGRRARIAPLTSVPTPARLGDARESTLAGASGGRQSRQQGRCKAVRSRSLRFAN